jgi:hypothetical protein
MRTKPWFSRSISHAVVLLLVGCSTATNVPSNDLLLNALTAEREAIACNRSVAGDARYRHLAGLIPLAAPYRASVVQMIDTDLANEEEVRTLTAWTQDIQKCRRAALEYIRQNSLLSLALVLSAWAEEDEVFVGVIQRKLPWGVAATRLRAAQIKLLSDLTDRAIQIDAQVNNAKQAELSRRVAVFDALTNLAP